MHEIRLVRGISQQTEISMSPWICWCFFLLFSQQCCPFIAVSVWCWTSWHTHTHSHTHWKRKSLFYASWCTITAQTLTVKGQGWNSAILFKINEIWPCSPINYWQKSIFIRKLVSKAMASVIFMLKVSTSFRNLPLDSGPVAVKICSYSWTATNSCWLWWAWLLH